MRDHRFFLAETPGGDRVELAPGEREHALKVLRVRVGDHCTGLNGLGAAWPLVVEQVGRRELVLRVEGPPAVSPGPGEEGSPLPWIEVAVAWPRRSRAEEMLGRLVQLGASAITPLVARRTGPRALPSAAGPSAGSNAPEEPQVGLDGEDRWVRLAQAACKQSGRRWMPRLGPRSSPAELLDQRQEAEIAVLDPTGGMSIDTWLRSVRTSPLSLGTRLRPIVLAIGPEGGFDEVERDAFLSAGATAVKLAPHVLRTETAAEAAMAVAAAVLMHS